MKLNEILYLLLILLNTRSWAIKSDSTVTRPSDIEDYYMFPIRPNEVNTLAGNMGELRASHFHAGLDIRTDGRTGLPVYAAADGYISRAAVRAKGYGKVLYITHNNDETTVYAHLSKFNGEISQHIKEHQYAQRNLYLNEYFKKNIFLVRKGQIIAYSGNSGSSVGPHLHFEIRDKYQQVLNPLKYHFEEIRDTIPPIFKKLAITPKNIDSRINGVFDRLTFEATKQGDNYVLSDTVVVFGKAGFELLAYDKLNDANYKCAISEITFELDNELIFNQKIDTINFSSQRNILMHYNYSAYISSGEKYHKLYLDDGNQLPFYTTSASKGVVNLNQSGLKHAIVTIKDVSNNKATLTFLLKILPPDNRVVQQWSSDNKISLKENTLIISQPIAASVSIELDGRHKRLSPSYSSEQSNCFLWDLRQGIPKKVSSDCIHLNYQRLSIIVPDQIYTYYGSNIEAVFGKSALFDTLYFNTSYQYDAIEGKEYYSIGDPLTSVLKQHIKVTLKSKINRTNASKQTTDVYQKSGDKYLYKGGKWKFNNISFKTRYFGEFVILADTVAPRISPVLISAESVRFTITDNLSGIEKINAFVDNQWVLMDYDYKTSQAWSVKIDNQPFAGEVRLRVTDNAGNEQTFFTKTPERVN